MKSLKTAIVLPFLVGIFTFASLVCSGAEDEAYWTFSQCGENPSDAELKPAVAAELEQYGAQFSAYLISAVEQVRAGNYDALQQLRSENTTPAVPFSREGVRIETISVKSETGTLLLRIYSPTDVSAVEGFPVVVYFHGGGWFFGSASGTDHIAVGICRTAACIVISVYYSLAPEKPYPAALEDCAGAVKWARYNVSRYRGDPTCIYVAGDSAGGNLAAAVGEAFAGRGLKGMILYYPALNLSSSDSGSMKRFATGYGLDAAFFRKAVACYIPDPAMRTEGTASPVNAAVHNLPPALIITAQFDILRDDAAMFARKLKRVRYICLGGVTHAYLDSPGCTAEFQLTMGETAGFIRKTLAP